MHGKPPYLAPEPEPVQSKQEEFDLTELPPGQGDLNYRPPVVLPANQGVWTIGELLLASAAAFPCGFLFRDLVGAYLLDLQIFLVVLLIAFLAGLVQPLRSPGRRGQGSIEAAMLAWFGVPVLTWATIALASLTSAWPGALLYLVLLPLPLTLFLADQLTTHAVWWMSAHPRLDLATMLAWREDWSQRFFSPPSRPPWRKDLPLELRELHERVGGTKRNYRLGLPLLASCILGALVFTALFAPAQPTYEHGFGFFLGLVLLLVVVCFLRTWDLPGAFGRLRFFFLAWVYAPADPHLPPWSFLSPTIPPRRRLGLVLACTFLWALALAFATDHFAWFFFLDPNPQLRPIVTPGAVAPDQDLVFLAAWPANAFAFTYILLAILACVLFPIQIFVLVVFLVTGPTLAGHFLALEANDAYEQR